MQAVCDRVTTPKIVALADHYADAMTGALPHAESEDQIRQALAGTLLSFLSDVLMMAVPDE